MTSLWYLASPNAHNVAATAFEEGLRVFKTKLTADPKKREYLDDLKAATLHEVLVEVSKAQAVYDAKRGSSQVRECILAFSKRVHHYGTVMDVMVQHHPEYASLAWGAMKIVFGSIVEHERLGSTIVTAMCDIADALPRIELAEVLYPTTMMKQTIALLYSYIIKFLLRALAWYETSTASRAIQSFTRPSALRYTDLIQDIYKATGKVNELSVAGSQAEQRDMHNKLRDIHAEQKELRDQLQEHLEEVQRQLQSLTTLVQQTNQGQQWTESTLSLHIQDTVVMNQNIMASQVDIRHQLSDVQLTQALTFISSSCSIDHKTTYQQALLFRQARKLSMTSKCTPFWDSNLLRTWNTSSSSSRITLKATFRDRLNVRDFSTNVIEQLMKSSVAIFWVLKTQDASYSTFDVLKSLIYQALTRDYVSHTDTVFSFNLRKFQAAHSLDDYLNLLGDLLEHLKLVYIIIDLDAVSAEGVDDCRKAFNAFSRNLALRDAKTVLKAMYLEYRPGVGQEKADDELLLRIARAPQRQSKRIPNVPLRGRLKLAMRKLPDRAGAIAM
ncbi:hypothetical protein BDV95DRAFT_579769 [Massariosphaeria phaeospora]|uniref:DUF7708 domain-containing protein n=1 Tax=Massariosphaeria phaeospora TaxID=100035 RepID=A0A7C8MAR5_9PLEO|nr:hypothetical protein BDV95DRAFT_579769 [Massariosphaeria phaeospora]